jgi:hypothetical protein
MTAPCLDRTTLLTEDFQDPYLTTRERKQTRDYSHILQTRKLRHRTTNTRPASVKSWSFPSPIFMHWEECA